MTQSHANYATLDTKRGVKTTRSRCEWSFAIRLMYEDPVYGEPEWDTVHIILRDDVALVEVLESLAEWAALDARFLREKFKNPRVYRRRCTNWRRLVRRACEYLVERLWRIREWAR